MQKNRKFYALLTVLCAAALFCIPLASARKKEAVVPTVATPSSTALSSATTDHATKKTTTPPRPTAADSAAVAALSKETFTVLHADGKTKSQISCREFLIFNLAAEMLPSFEPEALKAQAVASYTYF